MNEVLRFWPVLFVLAAVLCGLARERRRAPGRLILFLFINALAATALSITSYLLEIHAPLKAQAQAADRSSIWADLCGAEDEAQTAGCEALVTSPHGYVTVPWPTAVSDTARGPDGNEIKKVSTKFVDYKIPVAQLAGCYYWFVLIWFLSTGIPARDRRMWHLLPVLLSVIAVAASAYYIYVMAVELKQWCRLCLTLHAIDFALLPCVLLLWPRARRRPSPADAAATPGGVPVAEHPLRVSHALVTLGLIAVLIAGSFLRRHEQLQTAVALRRYATMQQRYSRVQSDTVFLLSAYRGTPAVSIPARATESALGAPEARHQLVIFSDLQCPVCRQFEEWFKREILELWRGQLRVVFRHFPLCPDCNPSQRSTEQRPSGLHPQACVAAYALEAARLQGGAEAFWKMHDYILQRQNELKEASFGPSRLAAWAADLGLDRGRFARDLEGQEVRKAVGEDVRVALQLKVRSTPTVFLDGRRLAPLQRGAEGFWKALADNALAAAESGTGNPG